MPVVDDAVPDESKVAQGIDLHILRIHASDRSDLGAHLFIPVREQEDDDRPANVPLVEAALCVRRKEVLRPRDPVMNHWWRSRVLHALVHHHGAALLEPHARLTVDPSDLALDPDRVPTEPGEAVHVDADLAVHEVDEVPENRQLSDGLVEIEGHGSVPGCSTISVVPDL
jgi:hypothetical protein